MSARSAQKITANYRGAVSIPHDATFLSVIKLTSYNAQISQRFMLRIPLIFSLDRILKMSSGRLKIDGRGYGQVSIFSILSIDVLDIDR
jgi:hypothetical protein